MREDINVQEAIHEEEHANDVNEIPDIVVNDPVESENETRQKLKSIMKENPKREGPCLRRINRGRLASEIEKIKESLAMIETNNLDELRDLIHAGASLFAEKSGVRNKPRVEKEPYWKRRIENDIRRLRKDLSRIEDWFKGCWTKKQTKEKEELRKRYKLREKGFKLVMEELKQRIKAKAFKVKRYTSRIQQYRQNRLFQGNQRALYQEIGGAKRQRQIPPNENEAKEFWKELWEKEVSHSSEADWLEQVKNEMKDKKKQENVSLEKNDLLQQLMKTSNWKSPGRDGIQGFWLKKFEILHDELLSHLNECVGKEDVRSWLVASRTVLIQKDQNKGNAAGNYRPIACLNVIWKVFTGILSEKLYTHVESNGILPEEQKGCRRRSRGTKDQLLIDKAVIRNCKRRKNKFVHVMHRF